MRQSSKKETTKCVQLPKGSASEEKGRRTKAWNVDEGGVAAQWAAPLDLASTAAAPAAPEPTGRHPRERC